MGKKFISIYLVASGILFPSLSPFSYHIAFAGSQAGQMGVAENTSALAGTLASALGTGTTALGMADMGKGAQEMSCCMTGCQTGAGEQTNSDNAAQDNAGQNAGNQVSNQPTDSSKPEAPEAGAPPPPPPPPPSQSPAPPNTPPCVVNGVEDPSGQKCQPKNLFSPSTWNHKHHSYLCQVKIPSKFNFFSPPQAFAAGGCGDAMQAMAKAASMIMKALQAMMAAQKANDNANTNQNNASRLSDISKGALTNGQSSVMKIDPSLLRDGTAGKAIAQVEKQFGIPRDTLINALQNGVDPRLLLANAPKNAIPTKLLNDAFSAAAAMSPGQQAAVMANANIEKMREELTEKLEGVSLEKVGSRSTSSTAKSESAALEDLNTLLGGKEPTLANQISPEIRAALEKESQAARKYDLSEHTIFQVVHNKYQEKLKMIFGEISVKRGIGNANGF